MLHHTLPKNEHEAAVIARSKQLTDFRWSPARDISTYLRDIGYAVLPAGEELVGFPYSSVEKTDKFITENVSMLTFLSAIPNPDSKLYQPGQGRYGTPNYGIVCNGLARYALGIRERVSTRRWLSIPGMNMIAGAGEFKAEDIRLCDILYAHNPIRSHVALITDILTDDEGQIVEIEVSEGVRPTCRRKSYPLDAFYIKYEVFGLARYDKLSEVPPLDEETDRMIWESGIEKQKPHITIDNGECSNYLLGQDVVVSAFDVADDVVELIRDGQLVGEYNVRDRAFFPITPERGYYTLRLRNLGEEAHFAVVGATLRHEVKDDMLSVWVVEHDKESKILYADFRIAGVGSASLEKYLTLTEEEKESGHYCREIPPEGKNFKVYFENKYGIWTQPMTPIDEPAIH